MNSTRRDLCDLCTMMRWERDAGGTEHGVRQMRDALWKQCSKAQRELDSARARRAWCRCKSSENQRSGSMRVCAFVMEGCWEAASGTILCVKMKAHWPTRGGSYVRNVLRYIRTGTRQCWACTDCRESCARQVTVRVVFEPRKKCAQRSVAVQSRRGRRRHATVAWIGAVGGERGQGGNHQRNIIKPQTALRFE